MSARVRNGLDIGAILVLLGIFGYAGFVKILDPRGFAGDLHAFGILPRWSIAPLAILLPAVECVTAAALLVPSLRGSAALLLAGLLAAFIGAGLTVIWRGLEVRCGCFGGASRAVGWSMIGYDTLLIIPAVWLIPPKRGGIEAPPEDGQTISSMGHESCKQMQHVL